MCPSAEDDLSSGDKDADRAESSPQTDSVPADEVSDAELADESEPDERERPQRSPKRGRQVSVSVRSLWVGAVIVSLIAGLAAMAWLYIGAKTKLDDQARQAADVSHAEKIALDYAVNAAIMDFKDLGPWKQNLVKDTAPELNKKLTEAATAMEQVLLPLQWSSTAKPLAAKLRSHDNGLYVVDAFVSVMTKTVQAAENLQSTATYSITINSNDRWLISDVGGIAAVVGEK
jgi:Mce-associated membrane protein